MNKIPLDLLAQLSNVLYGDQPAGPIDTTYLKLDASNDPIIGPLAIIPASDGTDIFQIFKSGGAVPVFDVDTTNARIGIGLVAPAARLHVLGAADIIQLLVKGNATQTTNLQEWHTSAGVVLNTISNTGLLSMTSANNTTFISLYRNTNNSDTQVGINFRDRNAVTGGQLAARINSIRDSSSALFGLAFHTAGPAATADATEKVRITSSGSLLIGTTTNTARLTVVGNENKIQLLVKGHSTQSQNFTEWQDSTGHVVAFLGPAGFYVEGPLNPYQEIHSTAENYAQMFFSTPSQKYGFYTAPNTVGSFCGFADSTATTFPFKLYPAQHNNLFVLNQNALGLNTTTPSALIHAVGTADQQQLIVKGYSTQTSNLVELQKSDASIQVSVDNEGGAVFNEAGNAAADFRVESDTYDALFVDASNDSIDVMHHASGKIGFFAQTPAVQQPYTAVSNPPTQAEVTAIRDALVNLGLMKVS